MVTWRGEREIPSCVKSLGPTHRSRFPQLDLSSCSLTPALRNRGRDREKPNLEGRFWGVGESIRGGHRGEGIEGKTKRVGNRVPGRFG